jgi:hypothetical protein
LVSSAEKGPLRALVVEHKLVKKSRPDLTDSLIFVFRLQQ